LKGRGHLKEVGVDDDDTGIELREIAWEDVD
jgi:hypothetical protein